MAKYFGTDGIRGRVPVEVSTSIAFKVGQSLKSALGTTRLVIGMDTRESSSDLLYSVISGARSVGIDVMNAGVVSTPLISLYSKSKKVDGVMITASHNPYTDNGIKVFHNGNKLSQSQELEIEDYIDNNNKFTVGKLGELYDGEDVFDLYLDLIESMEFYSTDLKVGIDSANGANYLISKGILQELVEHFFQIGAVPDGKNIFNITGFNHVISDYGTFDGVTETSTMQELLEAAGVMFTAGVPDEHAISYGRHSAGGWQGNYEAIEEYLIGKSALDLDTLVDWDVERWGDAVNEDNFFGIDVPAGATRSAQDSYDTIAGATVRMSRESTSFQRALVKAGILTEEDVVKGRF